MILLQYRTLHNAFSVVMFPLLQQHKVTLFMEYTVECSVKFIPPVTVIWQ